MYKIKSTILILTTLLIVSAIPKNSYAYCDTPLVAGDITSLSTQTETDLNNFITQEMNFIEKSFGTTTFMIKTRLHELDMNTRTWFSDWGKNKLKPALKDFTIQINAQQLEQNKALGVMVDSNLMNEAIQKKADLKVESKRRYQPTQSFCQIDTLGPKQLEPYQISKSLNRALTLEGLDVRLNTKGTASALNAAAEMKDFWDEYVTNFCDTNLGDYGCNNTPPGPLLGRHRDIPDLIWGDNLTIDMTNAENRKLVKAALRYMVYPVTPDPIVKKAVQTAAGRKEILERRAEITRTNTIYNVLGAILAERVGSNTETHTDEIREAAGIKANNISEKASYRETQEAVIRDRFYDPAYIVKTFDTPEQMTREQIFVGNAQLQIMNDIFRRNEELLFMMAAGYARDLDKQQFSSELSSATLK